MSLPRIGVRELVERLEALRQPGPAAIAFDADGTLWSGDVGVDAFALAIERGLIRAEAEEPLRRAAAEHGLETRGTPSEVAGRIFEAFVEQRFPERTAWEIMAWCFAGFTLDELAEHSRETFVALGLAGRLRRELEPVIDWARRAGVRATVISASIDRVVIEAASLWGFAPSDVAGVQTAFDGARIAPRVERFPYAEGKVEVGRALFGNADWLASFGDSAGDAAMLCQARLGIAVHPSPMLLERMLELPSLLLLEA